MRVLVVTVVHIPVDARIYHRQISALLDAGHTVGYAAPWSGYATARPQREGLDTLDLPRARGRRRLRALRAARRLLSSRRDEYDLILVHDPELVVAAAGLLGRLSPVVWDVHEDLAGSLGDRPWIPLPLRPATRELARRLETGAEQAVHLILAEEGYRERFRDEHPVVPNYPWLGEPPEARGEDRLIYVGRVSLRRGARELVEIGRRLAGDVQVELVGPVDEEVAGLIEAAHREGIVQHRGFMANPQAVERIDGALAGLSLLHDEPNYRSSLPTKVLEYLSRAVPAITTPLPAARRVVAEHAAGLVVGFGNLEEVVEDVLDAVRELREDPARRAAMGERGRAAVAERYCWEDAAPEFVHQLEQWAR